MVNNELRALKNDTAIAARDQALADGSAATKDPSKMGKEEFLKMLVTQLEHQDPMNPMDNNQFTAQLATFSQLEQLVEINKKLDTMNTANTSTQSMMDAGYVSYIGKVAHGNSEELIHEGGTTLPVSYTLPENAKSVKIMLTDKDGKIKREVDLDMQTGGKQNFAMDMTGLAPGKYKVLIGGKNFANKDIEGTPYQEGKITGISVQEGQTLLTVGGVPVPASKIYEIRDK